MPTLTLFLQLIAWEMRYQKARGKHRFLLHNPLTKEEVHACGMITIYVHRKYIDVLNGVHYDYDSS